MSTMIRGSHLPRDVSGAAVPNAVSQPLWSVLSNILTLESFGCVSDDINPAFDNTACINAALASGRMVYGRPGKRYRHTGQLNIVSGTKFDGLGFWSAVSATFKASAVTTFLCTGAGGLYSTSVAASNTPVGTVPTANIENAIFRNILIDCADINEIGFYTARAWSNNDFTRVVVTGARRHSHWAGQCWDGHIVGWFSYLCRGTGPALGYNIFGWANATVDESRVENAFGFYSGCDQSGNPLNAFVEAPVISSATAVGTTVTVNTVAAHGYATGGTVGVDDAVPAAYNGLYTVTVTGANSFTYTAGSAPGGNMTTIGQLSDSRQLLEAGLIVMGGRGLRMGNPQAGYCGGKGIVLAPQLSPMTCDMGYVEGCGRSSGASRAWALTFEGARDGSSLNCKVDGMKLGLTPAVLIAGTIPSRAEGYFKLIDMPALGTIVAYHNGYRTIDSDRTATVVGSAPANFRNQVNGFRNLDIIGSVEFDASTGSVVMLNMEGIISGVTRTAAGVYQVTFSETWSSAKYGAVVQSGSGITGTPRVSMTTTGFVINNYTSAYALSDTESRITAWVTGYRT